MPEPTHAHPPSHTPSHPPHRRLRHHPTSDGWTHVTRRPVSSHSLRKSKPRAQPNSNSSTICSADSTDSNQPRSRRARDGDLGDQSWSRSGSACEKALQEAPLPPRAAVRSVSQLRSRHAAALEDWAGSPTRRRLQTLVLKGRGTKSVKRIVCLGLGSLSAEMGWEGERSVGLQLGCLVDLRDLLMQGGQGEGNGGITRDSGGGESTGGKGPEGSEVSKPTSDEGHDGEGSTTEESRHRSQGIEVIAQDPVFNATDIAFLASLGITVANEGDDQGDAWSAIDSHTVVYAPHFPLGNAYRSFFYGSPSSDKASLPPEGNEDASRGDEASIPKAVNGSRAPYPHEPPAATPTPRTQPQTSDTGPALLISNDLTSLPSAGAAHVLARYDAYRFPYPEWKRRGKRREGEEDVEGLGMAFGGMWVYVRRDVSGDSSKEQGVEEGQDGQGAEVLERGVRELEL